VRVSKYCCVGGYVDGSGSPFASATGTDLAGRDGITFDLAVYLGAGDKAAGVGEGFAGWRYVDEDEERDGLVVCGEIVDWGGAPP